MECQMIIVNIAKASKSLSVDWDAMPDNAKQHLIEYGLRQKLNDAGSQFTTKALGEKDAGDKAFAAAQVTLEALMAGEMSVRSAKVMMTLEDKMFGQVLRAFFKTIFAKPADKDADNDDLILALVTKTGKEYEAIEAAIQAKANAMAALERQKAELVIEL